MVTAPLTADDAALLRFSRRAMATVFEVVLPWGTPEADESAQLILDEIDRVEQQLTVYRPTSEVSRLNRIAVQGPVPVEPGLFELLQLSARLHQQTGGAFDITAGPLIKAWGFFRRQGRVPTLDELEEANSRVGSQHIQFDAATRRIRFGKPGVEINFGSIGKGYALDRCADLWRARMPQAAALFNGGTSSVMAVGGPWPIGVRHPVVARRLGTLCLANCAMASSGATHQHFNYNGSRLGHLLDPRTGRPAEGVALAVAVAPTAAEADALSTAFYVLGPEGSRRYCAEHRQVGAVLLADEPDATPEVINLPSGMWSPAAADDWYDPVPSEDA